MTNDQRAVFKVSVQGRWSASMDEAPWTTAEHVLVSLDELKLEIDESHWREFYQARVNSVEEGDLAIGKKYTEQNKTSYDPPSGASFE